MTAAPPDKETPAMPTTITEPGIYDLPEADYHADPVPEGSLSASGARKLIRPSCPAKFRHDLDAEGEEHAAHFDFGKAAHSLVLGAGAEVLVVAEGSWRTKGAQEARDAAYATGRVPILAKDWQVVEAMAEQIRAHPIASLLFAGGKPEQSAFWVDETTGIWCRARFDWLPDPRPGKRLVIPDYKTARSAEPESFGRSADTYGYAQQAAWYLAGTRALGIADEHAAFVFVVQEKDAPHVVTVCELDAESLRVGEARNRQALGVFAHCRETGEWPGYASDIAQVSLPPWVLSTEGA